MVREGGRETRETDLAQQLLPPIGWMQCPQLTHHPFLHRYVGEVAVRRVDLSTHGRWRKIRERPLVGFPAGREGWKEGEKAPKGNPAIAPDAWGAPKTPVEATSWALMARFSAVF